MSRIKLPEFVHEVIDDPRQRGILIAGSLTLFAVGLVPRILSPGLPNAQDQLKSQPEIQNLFLLLIFVATAMLILGGLVTDLFRHRGLLMGALATVATTSAVSILVDQGAVYYAANLVAVGAAGIALAFGIGSVAIAYQGIPRATALGAVYAAFGAGIAISPALMTFFPRLIPSDDPAVPSTFVFDTRLAYLLTVVACGTALWAAYRYIPRIPGLLPASRWLVTAVAVWSISLIAITIGVLGLGGVASIWLPLALILGGAIGLGIATLVLRRRADEMRQIRLDRRALSAALTVGIAIGFAQMVPLMLLPIVFEYPLRYGTWWAVGAIAPFVIALLLAGPVSGVLLRRFGPRGILSVGTLAIGLANVLLALIIWGINGWVRDYFTADSGAARPVLDPLHYLLFIVPMIMIGAGFVVATVVRTAVVFATTPRGLPGSAAAINEASVVLGSRIGIVVATTALAAAAIGSFRTMAERARSTEAEVTALVGEFELMLRSLGTPRFRDAYGATLEGSDTLKGAAYMVAYLDGVTVALIVSALVAILGAVLAWILVGRRGPIETVFDMQDERPDPVEPAPADR